MRARSLSFVLALLLSPIARSEGIHPAVQRFKAWVDAVEAKDEETANQFFTPATLLIFERHEQFKDLLTYIAKSAKAEGISLSFEGEATRGHIVIKPEGARLPVNKTGDRWTLDAISFTKEVTADARLEATRAKLLQLSSYLQAYRLLAGNYPTGDQGLMTLVERPKTEPVPRRWKQWMTDLPKDPWGNEFIYKTTPEGFSLRSLGPDGVESDDDLVSAK